MWIIQYVTLGQEIYRVMYYVEHLMEIKQNN